MRCITMKTFLHHKGDLTRTSDTSDSLVSRCEHDNFSRLYANSCAILQDGTERQSITV